MIKRYYLYLITIIMFAALIFQVFIRYEIVEIGTIDLKYDRLTSKIYFRPMVISGNAENKWVKLDLKDFRLAKAWAFKNQVDSYAPDAFDIEMRLDELESNR